MFEREIFFFLFNDGYSCFGDDDLYEVVGFFSLKFGGDVYVYVEGSGGGFWNGK